MVAKEQADVAEDYSALRRRVKQETCITKLCRILIRRAIISIKLNVNATADLRIKLIGEIKWIIFGKKSSIRLELA